MHVCVCDRCSHMACMHTVDSGDLQLQTQDVWISVMSESVGSRGMFT